MAETWDREFFDIRDTEQRSSDGLVSVIEADANGVRDVGQTAESPQTVGEYMASLPVVQPGVEEVPGYPFENLPIRFGEDVSGPVFESGPLPLGQESSGPQFELAGSTTVDANGVRDVGQTAESPQTVGEYMASLPVVQPVVQDVPGVEFSEQEQPGPVDVFAMQSETPDFTASTDVDMAGYEWPEAVTPEVPSDTMSLPKAGVELPRRFQLRQEQQRRQESRANIRQLAKTDPRAAAEAANAERLERHRRGDWEDTFPEFEPQQEVVGAAEQPESPPPNQEKQRRLDAVASATATPPTLPDVGVATFPMPFGGGANDMVGVLREILAAIKELTGKMDPNARWGV